MNFEELLNVQEGQKPHRESTPLGSYYRRQVDGKYRYVIDLRPELTDSIVFSEALKQEQQWAVRQRGKNQLHYNLHQDSGIGAGTFPDASLAPRTESCCCGWKGLCGQYRHAAYRVWLYAQ